MTNYYLLQASGPDHPGIVASVTKILFGLSCNIEDSSMMKLGQEFGILLIFTSSREVSLSTLEAVFKKNNPRAALEMSLKKISKKLAAFKPAEKNIYLVTLHGADRPGLVFKATAALAKNNFNITDLSTHRTGGGKSSGYILFIEGELPSANKLPALTRHLKKLARSLKVHISIQPVKIHSL